MERVGHTPLPPYIHRRDDDASCDAVDRERYQTVFAEVGGAVAAPTASLHFTAATLAALDARRIERAVVTLHVGAGTFAPVSVERLDDHEMHRECYDMPIETIDCMTACRSRGGRIVAAGTTTVRVIESCASTGECQAAAGWTDLFIRPPYTFRSVDVLLTNFHLPRSTLLALVMAFAGTDLLRAAYDHAIRERYRFFSYGDAMLII